MCSKKSSFSCRHNALWCSSVGIAMFLAMVAGPSAESFPLINQTHSFFIGKFYKFSGYQHYKTMMNAYFFFSYNNSFFWRDPKEILLGLKCVIEFREAACPDFTYNSSSLSFFFRHDSIGLDRAIFEFRPPANTMFL